MNEFSPALLGSITEFGARLEDYTVVLGDLSAHAEHRGKDLPGRQYLIAALGSTDLLEINLFDQRFHLVEVAGSSAQGFLRAVGFLAPQTSVSSSNPGQPFVLRGVEQVLAEDPQRPFVAVIYAKLSPIALLCIPGGCGESNVPLIELASARLSACNAGIWDRYSEVAAANVPLETTPTILVSPVLGLDSVELTWVIRAARLEQVAALAWAVRHTRLSECWEGREGGRELTWLTELLKSDVTDLVSLWNSAPLFGGSTTVVGLRLKRVTPESCVCHEDRDGKEPESTAEVVKWDVETSSDLGQPACADGFLRARSSFEPGTFSPAPVVCGAKSGGVNVESADESPINMSPTVDSDEQSFSEFVMLFDRHDSLYVPATVSGGEALKVGPLSVGEIRSHLAGLIGLGSQPRRGVTSCTELGLKIRVPQTSLDRLPTARLLALFQKRLRNARRLHLSRKKADISSWTKRWLTATKEAGTPYPATAGGVNLISAVLGYLEEDLEGFVDLLGQIEELVQLAERLSRGQVTQADLLWLYNAIEDVASSRGRRDHPLRYPKAVLAFEGHAGHCLARDGFIAFVESLGRRIDPGVLHIVHDSSGADVSCDARIQKASGVSVPAMVLHHPVHWIYAHEIAHGRTRHAKVSVLCQDEEGSGRVHALTRKVQPDTEPEGQSIHWLLDSVSNALQRVGGSRRIGPFAAPAGSVLGEVLADLVLWESLHLSEDSTDRTVQKLYFVLGPSIVYASQCERGAAQPNCEWLIATVFRFFFIDLLLGEGAANSLPKGTAIEHRGSSEEDAPHWVVDLASFVRMLRELENAMETMRDAPPGVLAAEAGVPMNGSASRYDSLIRCIACLRLDLRLSGDLWSLVLQRLTQGVAEALAYANKTDQAVVDIVEAALAVVDYARQHLVVEVTDQILDRPRIMYSKYIGELMDSCPNARPWPVFTNRRNFEKDELAMGSHRFQDHENGLLISQRGGFLGALERRRKYRELTSKLLMNLKDYSRCFSYDKLKRYLDLAEP